eukprot:gene2082-biopygen15480
MVRARVRARARARTAAAAGGAGAAGAPIHCLCSRVGRAAPRRGRARDVQINSRLAHLARGALISGAARGVACALHTSLDARSGEAHEHVQERRVARRRAPPRTVRRGVGELHAVHAVDDVRHHPLLALQHGGLRQADSEDDCDMPEPYRPCSVGCAGRPQRWGKWQRTRTGRGPRDGIPRNGRGPDPAEPLFPGAEASPCASCARRARWTCRGRTGRPPRTPRSRAAPRTTPGTPRSPRCGVSPRTSAGPVASRHSRRRRSARAAPPQGLEHFADRGRGVRVGADPIVQGTMQYDCAVLRRNGPQRAAMDRTPPSTVPHPPPQSAQCIKPSQRPDHADGSALRVVDLAVQPARRWVRPQPAERARVAPGPRARRRRWQSSRCTPRATRARSSGRRPRPRRRRDSSPREAPTRWRRGRGGAAGAAARVAPAERGARARHALGLLAHLARRALAAGAGLALGAGAALEVGHPCTSGGETVLSAPGPRPFVRVLSCGPRPVRARCRSSPVLAHLARRALDAGAAGAPVAGGAEEGAARGRLLHRRLRRAHVARELVVVVAVLAQVGQGAQPLTAGLGAPLLAAIGRGGVAGAGSKSARQEA